MSYRKKDNIRLTYMENEKRMRLEGRLLVERLLNEAVAEMSAEFDEALANGQLLVVGDTRDDLQRYLRTAADKLLQGSANAKLKK